MQLTSIVLEAISAGSKMKAPQISNQLWKTYASLNFKLLFVMKSSKHKYF